MSMLETYGILPGETFNGLQNGRGRDIKSCLTFIRRPIRSPTDSEMKFNMCQVLSGGLMPHLCRGAVHPNDMPGKNKTNLRQLAWSFNREKGRKGCGFKGGARTLGSQTQFCSLFHGTTTTPFATSPSEALMRRHGIILFPFATSFPTFPTAAALSLGILIIKFAQTSEWREFANATGTRTKQGTGIITVALRALLQLDWQNFRNSSLPSVL